MLHNKMEPIKSYEELFDDAVNQIAMYSKEWTNYNPSDPGITILENLTAMQLLQQQSIETVSVQTRRNLLKLAGWKAGENSPSRVVLQMPEQGEGITLATNTKMSVGGLQFETGEPVRLRKKDLKAVYRLEKGILKDVTTMINPKIPMSVAIFGEESFVGNGIYLEFFSLPKSGESLTLYVQIEDRIGRNPWQEEKIPSFAKVSWELFTSQGWVKLEVIDKTYYFLKSGKISITMPDQLPKKGGEGLDGYGIRCILLESHYDVPAYIYSIFDNVLEAWQRNTIAACFSKEGNYVTIRSTMVNDELVQVFVREDGKEYYQMYHATQDTNAVGRFYRISQMNLGEMVLEFDAKAFGFGPDNGIDSVKLICYTEQSVGWRNLGTAYGYDNQLIEMENIQRVVEDGFVVMAEILKPKGDNRYYFCAPNSSDEASLGYQLHSEDGNLEIYNMGFEGECRLFLCNCAVTEGATGNLRTGNILWTEQTRPDVLPLSFLCLGCNEEGRSYESTEELTNRFVTAMRNPRIAVTDSDYERLAMQTPGLCLESARASVLAEENLVKIAVKPKSIKQFPILSDLYLEHIKNHLEQSRIIGTRIQIIQPRYVPIYLYVRLQVHQMGQEQQEQMQQVIKTAFENILKQGQLGGKISLFSLYQLVQELEEVAYLYEIKPMVSDPTCMEFDGVVVQMQPDCIAYLGDIQMQLVW